MAEWYVVQAHATAAKAAAARLRKTASRKGIKEESLDILVPTKIVKKGNKEVEQFIFPGYVFIRGELNANLLNAIKETDGIFKVIPSPVKEKDLQGVIESANAEKQPETLDFSIGDEIVIKDGVFESLFGTVIAANRSQQKADVEVKAFGIASRVTIPYDQIERRN